ncbi:universal stress protein [Mangrovimonas sp. CR14]|uniref:universal stress protein n=1 Tax=Mangrovimonas sp. CR14 TaxID=2706120 RepID=UPI001421B2E9|nr:universal stress protein [Mangrovimonas sp. CR14]NIK90984.1 universal stress protein [Mangrovimonas sp. CR14]
MRNILVLIGSSGNAKGLLQYAIDFAHTFNAKIYLVKINDIYPHSGTSVKVGNYLVDEVEKELELLLESVDQKGVEIISKSIIGELISTLETLQSDLQIDLLMIAPRTTSIKEEVYLGQTSGKVIKQTQIPALIVPENYVFEPISKILLAMKSANIKKEGVLEPLKLVMKHYDAKLDLLLVKTPTYQEADFNLHPELETLVHQFSHVESPTTFQGVLENYQTYQANLLCVVRRKRGFFTKLWESNTILKKDFHCSTMPVLVLSGIQ